MTLESLKAKLLSNPEVKRHYDELAPEFQQMRENMKKKRKNEVWLDCCIEVLKNIAENHPDRLDECYDKLTEYQDSLEEEESKVDTYL